MHSRRAPIARDRTLGLSRAAGRGAGTLESQDCAAVEPTWPELNRPSRCAPPRDPAAVHSSLEQPDIAGAAPAPTRTARASPLQSPSKRGATKTLPKKRKSPAKSVKAAAVSECEERRAPPLPASRRRLLQPAADACAAAHCMIFGC